MCTGNDPFEDALAIDEWTRWKEASQFALENGADPPVRLRIHANQPKRKTRGG
jgi:hypothetical protein